MKLFVWLFFLAFSFIHAENETNADFSKRLGYEGSVLLENRKSALPLAAGSKVAVFGMNQRDFIRGGGGPGGISVEYTRNLIYGLKEKEAENKISLFKSLIKFYETRNDTGKNTQKFSKKMFKIPGAEDDDEEEEGDEPKVPQKLLAKARAFADVAIISFGRTSTEKEDRSKEKGDFKLSFSEKSLIKKVVALSFSKVIVILNVGAVIHTSWFKDRQSGIDAALLVWLPGMEGGRTVADLLVGDAYPSGKLVDTFAADYEDYPTATTFGEDPGYVRYKEDIYVGYRFFETIPRAVKVASSIVNYEFGYGLGYTEFVVGNVTVTVEEPKPLEPKQQLTLTQAAATNTASGPPLTPPTPASHSGGSANNTSTNITSNTSTNTSATPPAPFYDPPLPPPTPTATFTVKATVTNVGARAGKEVVQVYCGAPQGKLGKPKKVLVAFAKTNELAANTSETLALSFSLAACASFDDHNSSNSSSSGGSIGGESNINSSNSSNSSSNSSSSNSTIGGSEIGNGTKNETGNSTGTKVDTGTVNNNTVNETGTETEAAWVLEAGNYTIYVGTSVRRVQTAYVYNLGNQDLIVQKLRHALVPKRLSRRLLANGSYEDLPLIKSNKIEEELEEKDGEDGEGKKKKKEEKEDDNDDDDEKPKKKKKKKKKVIEDGNNNGTGGGGEDINGTNVSDSNSTNISNISNDTNDTNTPPSSNRTVITLQQVAQNRSLMKPFLAQLDLDELTRIMSGIPSGHKFSQTGGMGGLPQYGVWTIYTNHAPAGVKINSDTTAYPIGTMLACTWNPPLIEQYGARVAEEMFVYRTGIWLAPAVNIHRDPLCGRNFEYLSEDPLVTGKIAAAMVRGAQSRNVAATLKHFAANNKEENRQKSDSLVSERAMREIYLKGFQIAVQEGKPWCVMTSQNLLNGMKTGERADLLTQILREEWGFDGVVMTDWLDMSLHAEETAAGLDVKMPAGQAKSVVAAVQAGNLTRAELERACENVLNMLMKTRVFAEYKVEGDDTGKNVVLPSDDDDDLNVAATPPADAAPTVTTITTTANVSATDNAIATAINDIAATAATAAAPNAAPPNAQTPTNDAATATTTTTAAPPNTNDAAATPNVAGDTPSTKKPEGEL